MTGVESVIAFVQNSIFVKVLLSVGAIGALANPIMHFFDRRFDKKMRLREIHAQERIAAAQEAALRRKK